MRTIPIECFGNEELAIAYLESVIWADGINCPKCGVVADHYKIVGRTARPGLRCCKACRRQFTAKVGTVFESSHIPVHKWLQGVSLLMSSDAGISALQLHHLLGVSYKAAWFIVRRLREALIVLCPELSLRLSSDRPALDPEMKLRLRRAHQKRLKIPEGYCRIFGAFAPIEFRDEIRASVSHIRRTRGIKAARAAVYEQIRVLRGYQDDAAPGYFVSKAYSSKETALPTVYGGLRR